MVGPATYGYGYSGYARESRPRQLNVRLLIVSIVVVVVGAPAVYFWHEYQTKQLSDSLWAYGEEKAKEENWREASAAFYRVWSIQRDPRLLGDAVEAYDKLVARTNRPELISAYQRAIGGLPDRLDLRARLAELQARERLYQSALKQTEKVLAGDAQNLKALKWRALSLLGLARNNQPVMGVDLLEELKQAYLPQQNDFELASALVEYIRTDLGAANGSELAAQAGRRDESLGRLQTHGSVQALLARYQYRKKHDLPGAKRDIEQAVLLAPESSVVVSQAAWDNLRDALNDPRQSTYLMTRQLFRNLIDLEPENENGYIGLGENRVSCRW